jgi:hypothetical protein
MARRGRAALRASAGRGRFGHVEEPEGAFQSLLVVLNLPGTQRLRGGTTFIHQRGRGGGVGLDDRVRRPASRRVMFRKYPIDEHKCVAVFSN